MSLLLSAVLHAALLVLPITILARQVMEDRPPVRVRLVNIPVDLLKPVAGPDKEAQDRATDTSGAEGISFRAEGVASVGYMDRLKARIFRAWEYPEDAILRGEEGKVSIEFVLGAQGELVDIGVLKSSGSPRLDRAAMNAVAKAAPFGPLAEVGGRDRLKVTGLFAYVLE